MDVITVSQFGDICRVCLKEGTLHSIFDYHKDASTEDLSNKMKSCAIVELSKDDGLPSNICTNCINLLLKAYDFKIVSESSDRTLRNILQHARINVNVTGIKDEPVDPPLSELRKTITSLKKSKTGRKTKVKKENIDLLCREYKGIKEDKHSLDFIENISKIDESDTNQDSFDWINNDCSNKSEVFQIEGSNGDLNKHTEECAKSDDDFDARANFMDNFYGCLECKKQFDTRVALHAHMAGQHGKRGAEHRCYGCALVFPTKYRRSQHESTCPSMPPGTQYHCRECCAVCETRREFDLHIRRHRPARAAPRATTLELGPLFPCPHCPKTLATHSSLYIHIQNHDKQNLVCEICGKCFKTRIRLMCHIKLHLNYKAFSCRECDFRTSTRNSLSLHLRKHSGERPYSCEVCGKRTATKSNLNSHRKRHTGVKDFKCDICGKTYMDKPPLEEHIIAVHAGLRPHDCPHCGATYTRKTGLRRHIKKRHPKGS